MCRSVSKKKGFESKMTTCRYDRSTDSNKDKFHCIKDFKNWGYLYLSLYERLQYIYIYERPRGPGDHNNVTTRRTRFSCRSLFVRNMKQVFIFRDIGDILVITKYCL